MEEFERIKFGAIAQVPAAKKLNLLQFQSTSGNYKYKDTWLQDPKIRTALNDPQQADPCVATKMNQYSFTS